jgi:hypothetical protein
MLMWRIVIHDAYRVWTTDCDIAMGIFLRITAGISIVVSIWLFVYAFALFDAASRDVHSVGV